MKYVVLKMTIGQGPASQELEVPVIFPNLLVHAQMAEVVRAAMPGHDISVVSAGEVNFQSAVLCSGKSESIGVKSRPDQDQRLITYNDYGAGFL